MTTCTKCGELLPRTAEFFASNGRKDYLRPSCRACQRKAVQLWQRENVVRHRAQNKRYYQRHLEQERARNRENRAKRKAKAVVA